jgi:hypothetical protein
MCKLLFSTDPLKTHWNQQLARLWPALKGSLAQVRKPCIRKHCPACARGDKHPAWILSFQDQDRRRCMYVPNPLVETLRQALRNGRKLEAELSRMGPALIKAYRQQRDSPQRTASDSLKSL